MEGAGAGVDVDVAEEVDCDGGGCGGCPAVVCVVGMFVMVGVVVMLVATVWMVFGCVFVGLGTMTRSWA